MRDASWPAGQIARRGTNATVTISEPITAATDYAIAIACAVFAISLSTRSVAPEWTLGFALGGISALLGGLNVAGIAVQMRQLTPHARFNHNDLFHVF